MDSENGGAPCSRRCTRSRARAGCTSAEGASIDFVCMRFLSTILHESIKEDDVFTREQGAEKRVVSFSGEGVGNTVYPTHAAFMFMLANSASQAWRQRQAPFDKAPPMVPTPASRSLAIVWKWERMVAT